MIAVGFEPEFLLSEESQAGVDDVRVARCEAHFALYSKSEAWGHRPGLAILSACGFEAAKHDGSPYRPGDNTGGLLVAPDAARLEVALARARDAYQQTPGIPLSLIHISEPTRPY